MAHVVHPRTVLVRRRLLRVPLIFPLSHPLGSDRRRPGIMFLVHPVGVDRHAGSRGSRRRVRHALLRPARASLLRMGRVGGLVLKVGRLGGDNAGVMHGRSAVIARAVGAVLHHARRGRRPVGRSTRLAIGAGVHARDAGRGHGAAVVLVLDSAASRLLLGLRGLLRRQLLMLWRGLLRRGRRRGVMSRRRRRDSSQLLRSPVRLWGSRVRPHLLLLARAGLTQRGVRPAVWLAV